MESADGAVAMDVTVPVVPLEITLLNGAGDEIKTSTHTQAAVVNDASIRGDSVGDQFQHPATSSTSLPNGSSCSDAKLALDTQAVSTYGGMDDAQAVHRYGELGGILETVHNDCSDSSDVISQHQCLSQLRQIANNVLAARTIEQLQQVPLSFDYVAYSCSPFLCTLYQRIDCPCSPEWVPAMPGNVAPLTNCALTDNLVSLVTSSNTPRQVQRFLIARELPSLGYWNLINSVQAAWTAGLQTMNPNDPGSIDCGDLYSWVPLTASVKAFAQATVHDVLCPGKKWMVDFCRHCCVQDIAGPKKGKPFHPARPISSNPGCRAAGMQFL